METSPTSEVRTTATVNLITTSLHNWHRCAIFLHYINFNNSYLPRHFEDKDHWWTFSKKRDVTRWTLTLITGFLCGLVALFVNFFTKIITKWKYNVFHGLIESEKAGTISPGIGFIFLFAVNLVFALIAWFTCYMEPLASGSGLCTNTHSQPN